MSIYREGYRGGYGSNGQCSIEASEQSKGEPSATQHTAHSIGHAKVSYQRGR